MIQVFKMMELNSSAVFRLCLAGFFLLAGGFRLNGAEDQKAPPKDLVEYVREAAKLGLQDAQIQQNAVNAGWSASTVEEAIAYVRSGKQPDQSAPSTTALSHPPAPNTPGAAATSEPGAFDPSARSKARGVPDDYQIGAGDTLQISVWKEPEASVANAVVRPDGKIGMPLLKEVEVVGLTPREAEKIITSRLSKYIPAADVTVVVSGINSKKIYIVGAVKKEGPIPYTYRMTVLQALSEAGGLNDYAKRKKIYVLRTENGKEYKLPFDYDAVLKGERMELNIPLLPNDTVVVPH
ncbi:MAG TPA: polysaccharide biosynthesis/export family protein [Candidatus Acidoferrum sp.]|nr:polysaccharide biosynthesis/export family protein [Candidatus Acidoferrum sp.]